MIFDELKNSEFYNGLGEGFVKAFTYLKETDLDSLEVGKHIIDGEDLFIFVNDYSTKNIEEAMWEGHKEYIDIQYVIEGKEMMGYTSISNMIECDEYNKVNDIFFGKADGQFVIVGPGEFAVFTPKDAHMPSLKVENDGHVRKIVVKMKINEKNIAKIL